MKMEVEITDAIREQCPELSDLAFRSKASWGYDTGFMNACREELTIDPEYIDSNTVKILRYKGTIAGVYSIVSIDAETADLGFFFIDPDQQGKGLGRIMLEDAIQTAAKDFQKLQVESDPHAESFYTKMGGEVIGSVPSGSIKGRSLPLLSYDLK